MNGYKVYSALGVSYTITFTRMSCTNPTFEGYRVAKVRVGYGKNHYAMLAEYDPKGDHALLSSRDLDVVDAVLVEVEALLLNKIDPDEALALLLFVRARLYELRNMHRC